MGPVLGSTQALCRSIYARMIPEQKKNEFFGFNAFASKVSAVLGPLAFGLVTTATGSQRAGLLSLLVFFVGGALVLLTVRVPADAPPPSAPPAPPA
jgi:UMF1 family MFS transporter